MKFLLSCFGSKAQIKSNSTVAPITINIVLSVLLKLIATYLCRLLVYRPLREKSGLTQLPQDRYRVRRFGTYTVQTSFLDKHPELQIHRIP